MREFLVKVVSGEVRWGPLMEMGVQTDKGVKRWRRSDQMTKPTTPNKRMTGGYSSDSRKNIKTRKDLSKMLQMSRE